MFDRVYLQDSKGLRLLRRPATGCWVVAGQHLPDLKLRFVNVVNLFKRVPDQAHPHGLSNRDFDALFTMDRPIIFNFHGYPWLTYRRKIQKTCTSAATRSAATSTR